MFGAIHPHLDEIRNLLDKDNQRDIAKFSDMEWRLSMVTGCRARQKIMVPKYTIKLDLQKAVSAQDDVKNNTATKKDIESVLIDADYNNLAKL